MDAERFARVQEVLVRKYRNANMAPSKHAAYLRLRCLKASWPVEAVLAELEALTPDALRVCFLLCRDSSGLSATAPNPKPGSY